MSEAPLAPVLVVQKSILLLRGLWVILDGDLARIYGVPTHRLNEQVRRNRRRFPSHFLFRLSREEASNLRSQNAISSWGGRRSLPYAFTEAGAVMVANVLRTPRAVELSVQVVEAFVRLSRAASIDRTILDRIAELERTSRKHDAHFQAVFAALRERLFSPKPRRQIGFRPPKTS